MHYVGNGCHLMCVVTMLEYQILRESDYKLHYLYIYNSTDKTNYRYFQMYGNNVNTESQQFAYQRPRQRNKQESLPGGGGITTGSGSCS